MKIHNRRNEIPYKDRKSKDTDNKYILYCSMIEIRHDKFESRLYLHADIFF
jgi:hypothetical protein